MAAVCRHPDGRAGSTSGATAADLEQLHRCRHWRSRAHGGQHPAFRRRVRRRDDGLHDRGANTKSSVGLAGRRLLVNAVSGYGNHNSGGRRRGSRGKRGRANGSNSTGEPNGRPLTPRATTPNRTGGPANGANLKFGCVRKNPRHVRLRRPSLVTDMQDKLGAHELERREPVDAAASGPMPDRLYTGLFAQQRLLLVVADDLLPLDGCLRPVGGRSGQHRYLLRVSASSDGAGLDGPRSAPSDEVRTWATRRRRGPDTDQTPSGKPSTPASTGPNAAPASHPTTAP